MDTKKSLITLMAVSTILLAGCGSTTTTNDSMENKDDAMMEKTDDSAMENKDDAMMEKTDDSAMMEKTDGEVMIKAEGDVKVDGEVMEKK